MSSPDAKARLQASLPPDAVSEAALQQMDDALTARLRFAASAVHAAAHRAASRMGMTAPRSLTLDAYPVFQTIRRQLEADWLTAMIEMVERFRADHPASGTLQAVQADLGDRHGGGRAVARLTPEHGPSLFYKPRDLRVSQAFQGLLAEMNAAGLSPALQPRRIDARPTHAWEHPVAARACQTIQEVHGFYVRFGMLLRLMQALDARDLWLDNLIASGAHPVFIDLETILQPRWPRTTHNDATRQAREWWNGSVAPTAMLAHPMRIRPGVRAEDIGALTPQRLFTLPFVDIDGQPRTFTRPAASPRFLGQPVPARDHIDQIEEGYDRMTAFLIDHPPSLARFAGLPVRVLHRGTVWAIGQALRSVSPSALSDGGTRQAILDAIPPKDPRLLPAERQAIARLDVPLFTAYTDQRAVEVEGGERIEAVFGVDALSRAHAGLRRRAPLEPAHRSAIRGCLATGRHGSWRMEPLPPATLQQAIVVGDEILDCAFRGADGSLAWVGWNADPAHGMLWFGVLGPDWWSGTLGISRVFRALYAHTGLERFQRAAQAIQADHEPPPPAPTVTVDEVPFSDVGAIRRPMRLVGPIAADRRWNLSALWGLGAEVLAGLPGCVIPWARSRC